MNICEFKYEDSDIVSDKIIEFYNLCENKENIESFINMYINNKKFYDFVQKNILINRISEDYLVRLYNDFDDDSIIEEIDNITSVNVTRWI